MFSQVFVQTSVISVHGGGGGYPRLHVRGVLTTSHRSLMFRVYSALDIPTPGTDCSTGGLRSGWYASYWNAFLLPGLMKLFLLEFVILFSRGVCYPQCMPGIPPPGADTPPRADPPEQTYPLSMTPPPEQTPSPLGLSTPPGTKYTPQD